MIKVLYAIQGTGNGHLARAREVVPILKKLANCDVLVSGIQGDISLPFDIDYQFTGWSFIFGKKGGVDLWQTIRKTNLPRLFKEMSSIPVHQYDLVINDFEPLTAWACRFRNIPCFSLSHQFGVNGPSAPKAMTRDWLGKLILTCYASTEKGFGFHFERYDQNTFTPVIRKEIRALNPTKKGHYTVYLPAYSDKRLIDFCSKFPDVNWHIFSKHSRQTYNTHNIIVQPVNNEQFLKSFESCNGLFCGAGFETPAEALFMGKKLFVIPMKNQYEQHLNAAALEKLGIPVETSLSGINPKVFRMWLAQKEGLKMNYPDQTEFILQKTLETAISENHHSLLYRLIPEWR